MTKNREIAEYMFEIIKQMGYKPYDISYGDSYFLFDMGEDSVVHFRLKGVWKHWKFGMWINSDYLKNEYREKEKEIEKMEDYYKVVQIFAQHDTWIDKFKPSRSSLCVSYYAEDWCRLMKMKDPWHKLRDMLGMMKKHPFMCYCEYCGEYVGYYSGSFLMEYIKTEFYHHKNAIKKSILKAFWGTYTKIKCYFARKSDVIHKLEIHNFEKENPGWRTSYIYYVNIIFAKESTDEERCKWLDLWFKRKKYGKFDYYDFVVEVDNFMEVGSDERFSYKFLDDFKKEKKNGSKND